METDTMEALVEVKTKLLAASAGQLLEMARGLGLEADASMGRAKLVLEVEGKLLNITKEENAAVKLRKLSSALEVKPSVKTEKPRPETTEELLKTHLRKEFKIYGNIGEGKNCIGYMSFLRQIESGKAHGHSERDLVDGVIKAIQGGSRLRGYLEGCDSLTLPKLQGIIRAFYKEKSATELYQELCGLKQIAGESTQEFVFRALELRQKLMFASKENTTINYEPTLVERSFRHSVSTGIRCDRIRMECHQLLQCYTNDEQLIQGVNDIVRRSEENKQKLLSKSCPSETEESAILKELKSLRAEVNQLKLTKDTTVKPQQGRKSKPKSCGNCGPTERCSHCWRCGSQDHFQRRCPENSQGSAQRGEC